MELTDLNCLQITCPYGIGYTPSLGLNSPAYRLAGLLRLKHDILNERWCLARHKDAQRDGAQSVDDLRRAIHGDRES